MSSWGCPHDVDGKCMRVKEIPCDPGMKGCVLYGRFIWGDPSKNRQRKKHEQDPENSQDSESDKSS